MPTTSDTVALQFAALILTPTVQEPTAKALDEEEDNDNLDLAVRLPLSPRKPKSKPGRMKQVTADLLRKFPPPAMYLTHEKQAFMTAFVILENHRQVRTVREVRTKEERYVPAASYSQPRDLRESRRKIRRG